LGTDGRVERPIDEDVAGLDPARDRLSPRLRTLAVSASVAVPVAAAASWNESTCWLRSVAGSGVKVIVPSFPVARRAVRRPAASRIGEGVRKGGADRFGQAGRGLVQVGLLDDQRYGVLAARGCGGVVGRDEEPSQVRRDALDRMRAYVARGAFGDSRDRASTDPTWPVEKTAFGTVTARVVANATPPLVDTCVPAGTGTAMNVLVLEKRHRARGRRLDDVLAGGVEAAALLDVERLGDARDRQSGVVDRQDRGDRS